MRARKWRSLIGKIIFVGGIFLPSMVMAQGEYFLTPSITLAEIYDDNIFFTASREEEDFITRASPALTGGYRSVPFTLIGFYTFDAEYYANNTDLNDVTARQEVGADLIYRPDRLLTLSSGINYIETESPQELNFLTGVSGGRVDATRFSVTPSASYQFDALTSGRAGYTYTLDKVDSVGETLDTETHITSLGLDRRFTRRDTGHLGFIYRRFHFEGDSVSSYVPTVGWTHRLTQRTSFTLIGGPRFTDGESVEPEILALVRHRIDRGELTFGYARSESTVLGETGRVQTETFEFGVLYSPARNWEIRAAPSYVKSERGNFDTDVYRANVEVRYQATRYMSIFGSVETSYQDGSLGGPGGDDISRNIVMVGVVLTAPSWPKFEFPSFETRPGRSVLPNRTLAPDEGSTPNPGEER